LFEFNFSAGLINSKTSGKSMILLNYLKKLSTSDHNHK